jgi:hypothetical protein
MSPTTTRPVSARAVLGTLGATTALAALTLGGVGAVGIAHGQGSDAINAAYGVAAKGTDNQGPTPLVTSNGKAKTDSGSAAGSSGQFAATNMSVRAAAGQSEAKVGNLIVAGENFGSISATCEDGVVTSVEHDGTKPSKPNVKVYYGKKGGDKVIGITVHVVDDAGKVTQEVTAAAVRCAEAPEEKPDKPVEKPDRPDKPVAKPKPAPEPAKTVVAAPAPTSTPGHHPVTG